MIKLILAIVFLLSIFFYIRYILKIMDLLNFINSINYLDEPQLYKYKGVNFFMMLSSPSFTSVILSRNFENYKTLK